MLRTSLGALQLSLSFLTRLPVGTMPTITARHWQWMSASFPLAGYALAALALYPAYSLFAGPGPLSALLTAAVTTCLLAWLTRGLHLDGLADLTDGMGVLASAARRLEVMKDPHPGSFAVVALSLALLLKTLALAVLFAAGHWQQAAAVLVLSRFCLTVLNATGRYARPEGGTAMHTIGQVPTAAVVTALLLTMPVLLTVAGAPIALAIMLLLTIVLRLYTTRILGGITGDVLGAGTELSEICGYLVMAALISNCA